MTAPLAAPARVARLVVHGAVATPAIVSGALIALQPVVPVDVLRLPPEYLAGSPFGSYLAPGLVLAAVVGGTHLAAFLSGLRRSAWAPLLAAVAGVGLLVWMFVQMVVIPFSPLQAVYEGAAILELGLLLVELGLFAGLVRRPLVEERVSRSLAS